MNRDNWLYGLFKPFRATELPDPSSWDARQNDGFNTPFTASFGASSWRSLFGRNPTILEVEDEVTTEQQGRLLIVSRHGELASRLLAALRQQAPLSPVGDVTREGFFTLVALAEPATPSPDAADYDVGSTWVHEDWFAPSAGWAAEPWQFFLEATTGAELLLYLFAGVDGWQAEDARWCARLRSLGIALLPVMVLTAATDATVTPLPTAPPAFDCSAVAAQVQRSLGIYPAVIQLTHTLVETEQIQVAVTAPEDELHTLVRRILSLRPRLAIPLAQESPICREMIARRVIRSGALVAALVGSEPVPLLDVPLHVAVHWKVVLQLAAIYGRPGLDYRSREMVGTVGLNLTMRFVAQQAVKAIPVVGWLCSGLLSGVSVTLLGHTMLRLYEQEAGVGQAFSLHALRQRPWSHMTMRIQIWFARLLHRPTQPSATNGDKHE